MQEAILAVKNLALRYPGSGVFALREFNMEVSAGEVIAIAGQSGSGKSSLLHALAGLLDAAEGEIFFQGKLLPGPSARLVPGHPDIALAFQDNRLSPMLSLADNLKAAMRGFVPDYIVAETEKLLKLCRIWHLAAKKPVEISGGERQRAALCMALAIHPAVLLLDEPFSNLDIMLKNALLTELMQLLRSRFTTVILVSHDPADALSQADRIFLLKEGELIESGNTANIYNFPKTDYAAGFFGENNRLNPFEAGLFFNNENLPAKFKACYIRPHLVHITDINAHNSESRINVFSHRYKVRSSVFYGSYRLLSLEPASESGLPLLNAVVAGQTGYGVGNTLLASISSDDLVFI
ncbi:MAG: ABC transporter ATP-binding protein [Bacteroidota bacterium]